MAGVIPREERMVHIRFDGRSWQVPAATLGIRDVTDETAVKQAVAAYLDIAVEQLAPYVVEVHPSGNVTVRPEAVFG
ncbi:MAG TPA: hypothetical protein VGP82_04810 [Ktedonobacterales bacterium]|jgi:hypothetical protein|nr:hypothetical protein [Ktedonobacterales bacterium]